MIVQSLPKEQQQRISNVCKNMARTWQEHGKTIAKTWQEHGKSMARTWQEHSKSSAIPP
jgi:hypothetical protein